MTGVEIWPGIAGLGLFLFGLGYLERSAEALAGRSFKRLLRRHTGRPFAGRGHRCAGHGGAAKQLGLY